MMDKTLRDNLLVTAGVRAAYMHDAGVIDLPGGLLGEEQLAKFISEQVDAYAWFNTDVNFDEYIESALFHEYAFGEVEPNGTTNDCK